MSRSRLGAFEVVATKEPRGPEPVGSGPRGVLDSEGTCRLAVEAVTRRQVGVLCCGVYSTFGGSRSVDLVRRHGHRHASDVGALHGDVIGHRRSETRQLVRQRGSRRW